MTVVINGTTGYSGPVGTIGDLTTTGNTTLGDASGDTLTINGNTASIPNDLNFTGGNLGLDVTPSAWTTNYRAMQIGSAGNSMLGGTSGIASFALYGQNLYYDGTNFRYVTSNAAGYINIASRQFTWNSAPAGTAGDPITFTQVMTLNDSGNLGVGSTSPSTRLDVAGGSDATTGIMVRISSNSSGAKSKTQYTDNATYNLTFGADGSGNFVWSTGEYPGTSGTERARITSGGSLIVGGGATSSSDTMLLQPSSGDSVLRLTGGGSYVKLNSTTVGYQTVAGLDNGTTRWTVGQIGRGGSDGASIYYGSSGTEAARFASTITTYRPVALSGGMANAYSGQLSGTYTSGTWYPIASSGNMGSGVFIMTLYVDTYAAGGSVYYMNYASVPFYIYDVGSNSGSTFTLPTFFGTGHADNGNAAPPVRLRLSYSGAGIFIDIQPNQNWNSLDGTGGKNVAFYFKRIA